MQIVKPILIEMNLLNGKVKYVLTVEYSRLIGSACYKALTWLRFRIGQIKTH